ncbi:MAG: biotin carboxylase [Deltaproteobacteria bacterium]|jgi:acetyl-CoA carboxylase biotin carboxylase subunit|nr:biotin carboxylase [Deltaproteobacteria bacterium]
MFSKVAINNRAAVARRIIRTLRDLGVKSVILCSEADLGLPYVQEADERVILGPASAADSYLNHDRVLAAVKSCGADALHPGYGFLAEDAAFAQKLRAAGVTFIGPRPELLAVFGDKVQTQKEMAARGLPINRASELLTGTLEERLAVASEVGFPLLVKPAGGGGGIGMIPVLGPDKLAAALATAASQAQRGFGRDQLYVERLLENPRHVEFQVVADGQAGFHLFERDCSIQRRRQKILEEAGAPCLPRAELTRLAELSAQVLATLGYDHVGTVETLYQAQAGFVFLEVNPRLQVEHAVTEEITGYDLVETQLRLASGSRLPALPVPPTEPVGHAVEARIYAEDSQRFLPSPGTLKVFRPPQGPGIRVETGYAEGAKVTPYYDPMVAQVIARGRQRDEALDLLSQALGQFEIEGIKTNLVFLRQMLNYPPFRAGNPHTGLTDQLLREPSYRALWEK